MVAETFSSTNIDMVGDNAKESLSIDIGDRFVTKSCTVRSTKGSSYACSNACVSQIGSDETATSSSTPLRHSPVTQMCINQKSAHPTLLSAETRGSTNSRTVFNLQHGLQRTQHHDGENVPPLSSSSNALNMRRQPSTVAMHSSVSVRNAPRRFVATKTPPNSIFELEGTQTSRTKSSVRPKRKSSDLPLLVDADHVVAS